MNNKNQIKRVVALGKFDGLHLGHMKLLETAVIKSKELDALSQVLFIGTPKVSVCDEKVLYDIAKKAGIDILEKQELTKEFMSMSAENFVGEFLKEKLCAVHVVVGYNFRFAKNRSAGVEELKKLCHECDIGCTVIPEVMVEDNGNMVSVSSTKIRELVSEGKIESIEKYLTRPYSLSGIVSHGRHLGSTLDFPTANIRPPKSLVMLPNGVYITVTEINSERYYSVTNIGNNPTVSDENPVTVETFIFDFSKDIYDKNITVYFLEKIRDEVKFASFDELKKSVEADKKYALSKKYIYKRYIS